MVQAGDAHPGRYSCRTQGTLLHITAYEVSHLYLSYETLQTFCSNKKTENINQKAAKNKQSNTNKATQPTDSFFFNIYARMIRTSVYMYTQTTAAAARPCFEFERTPAYTLPSRDNRWIGLVGG